MKKILILISEYLPGQKNGGPVRTIINLTNAFGDEYEFFIVCLDKSAGDKKSYPNISKKQWNIVGKAKVFYLKKFTLTAIKRLSKGKDLIYACGLFSKPVHLALIANRIRFLNKIKLIVAPMGVFSEGAYKFKKLKKSFYIFVMKLFGMFNSVIWSVTSELELNDLKKVIGPNCKCIIAEDLPRDVIVGKPKNVTGTTRVVFLSRICPKKNLLGAIQVLSQIKDQVVFDIYGTIEDYDYWKKCEKELANLPSNIIWKYLGFVCTDDVPTVFQKHDVFLFPTFGENYGHVIFEALSAGCIPLISDQTPWTFINDIQAGFALPLTDDMSNFAAELTGLIELDSNKKWFLIDNGIKCASNKLAESKTNSGYIELFKF